MVFLIGSGKKVKKDIWAGKFQCPVCGSISNFHLHKVKAYSSIFYIPIFSITQKRLFACDSCQSCRDISKKEYNDIKKSQNEKMKSGEFPSDVVAQDFNPKEVKFGRKMFALVLAAIFCFFMTVGAIGLVSGIDTWDASVLPGLLFMLAIGLLPLVFAVRSVAAASQKRKIYSSLCNGQTKL